MDATSTTTVTVIKKNTVQLNSGEQVICWNLPKKSKVGENVSVLLEQGKCTFVSLTSAQAEKVSEEQDFPFRFINFLDKNGDPCHSYILNRDGKIYQSLAKRNMKHINMPQDMCPICGRGGQKVPTSEIFKENVKAVEKIEDMVEKILQKKEQRRKPNKSVKFSCGHTGWVNKLHENYENYDEGETTSEVVCPRCAGESFGFGEEFFKIFAENGGEF